MARKRFMPGRPITAQFSEIKKIEAQVSDLIQLTTEIAKRSRDPYEYNYMGVLQNTDPLVQEKGESSYDLYSDLLRDFKVFACYQKRILTIISKPWQVSPVEKSPIGTEHASIITEILKRSRFDQVCKDLLDALIMGLSVSEIVWTVRDGYIVPDRIVKRAQRRFIFKDVDNASPELRLKTKENMQQGISLPDKKFIVHRYGSVDDNPYGQGIGLQLYWLVYFKRANMISWNKLNDRYGTPTPWGKYAPNATKEAKDTLFDALMAFSNDGVIMTPDTATIQLLEAALGGNVDSHERMDKALNNAIAAVLNGENGSENSGGALAAASVERGDVLSNLAQGDSDLLSDTLNETLINWICELNGFMSCQVSRPVQEEEDLKATAETDALVANMGFTPSLDMVRTKYGEGWEKRTDTGMPGMTGGQPYAYPYYSVPQYNPGFAEAQATMPAATPKQEQALIDEAVNSITANDFDEVMQSIIQPLLKAVDESATFEEAHKKVQAAMPHVDASKLESALAQVMFGAQVVGHGVKE